MRERVDEIKECLQRLTSLICEELDEYKKSKSVHGDADSNDSVADLVFDFMEKTNDVVPELKPAWMRDIPGEHVSSIMDAITPEQKVNFIQNLFDNDEDQYDLSMMTIDDYTDFDEVVDYLRIAFPDWDESSSLVYDFYMLIRRRFI